MKIILVLKLENTDNFSLSDSESLEVPICIFIFSIKLTFKTKKNKLIR